MNKQVKMLKQGDRIEQKEVAPLKKKEKVGDSPSTSEKSVVANTVGGAPNVAASKTWCEDTPTIIVTYDSKAIQEEVKEKKIYIAD